MADPLTRYPSGTCVRCHTDDSGGIVADYPDPAQAETDPETLTDRDTVVRWCLSCWARAVADRTALSREEATAYGATEHAGLSPEETQPYTGRTEYGVEQLRARAVRKLGGEQLEPAPLTFLDRVRGR